MDSLHRKCGSVLIGFILGFAISTWAADIPTPPLLPDLPVSLQHYLGRVHGHLGHIEVVTSNPDGSRNGQKGDMLHLQSGGNYYNCTNVDGSTTWRCAQLTDTP